MRQFGRKKNEFILRCIHIILSWKCILDVHRRGGELYTYMCVFLWPAANGWHVLFKNRNNVHLVITIYYFIPTFYSRLCTRRPRRIVYIVWPTTLTMDTRVLFNYPNNFIDILLLWKRVDRDFKFVFDRETFCIFFFLWFHYIPVMLCWNKLCLHVVYCTHTIWNLVSILRYVCTYYYSDVCT